MNIGNISKEDSSHEGSLKSLQNSIEESYTNPSLLKESSRREAVTRVLELLEQGKVRVASPSKDGGWKVHPWVKKAILLYYKISPTKNIEAGELSFFDKVPSRTDYEQAGVRVVPPAICRHGAHLEPGVILMPSFVNIGAYVGSGTMVDTWATVGSCAQIGENVHLSGGVGIGGVLEPPQGRPVIVEDNAFLGSRAIVVEGVLVGKGAVLGAGTIVTSSTPILDVSGKEEKIYKGSIPAYSVVIPGVRVKEFPAGSYGTSSALIIGKRTEKTDKKTSLEKVLREFGISV